MKTPDTSRMTRIWQQHFLAYLLNTDIIEVCRGFSSISALLADLIHKVGDIA
ncbi:MULTISPECIES: hypothetical protein [Paenibacillus]|uniref:hypothetical protein n=1 Tax=Paenibacillus TaxID=44249 RepID=UPI001493021C|nr:MULTISPECIES: hypothetical protein [Paenibacillus]